MAQDPKKERSLRPFVDEPDPKVRPVNLPAWDDITSNVLGRVGDTIAKDAAADADADAAADDDGDGFGKAFLGALAHIGAGMAYGAGAGLAGTDPTYLAKQVQIRKEQQEAQDELISVQDAVKAGNPEEYEAFEEALGGRSFKTLASFNAAWNSYSVGRQGARDEFDAGELIPTYASILEEAGQGHVVEEIMQSEASNTAQLGVLRERATPYIESAMASAERIQAARDQFKGIPIKDIMDTLIENGYRREELSEMSDDDILQLAVAASANVTSVDMERVDPRGQDGQPLHLDKLSQLMPDYTQEEIGRLLHTENLAIQDKSANDALWEARLEYTRQEEAFMLWMERERAVREDISRAIERGDVPPRSLGVAYETAMQAMEAELWPISLGYKQGQGRPNLFADPAPGSTDPNNSDMGTVRISSLAMLAKGAVEVNEALQRAGSPEQVTPRALAAMDSRQFTAFIKDLPEKQAGPLRAKYDLYRRADAGRVAISTVISEVGSDPQIAALFGYEDFVEHSPEAVRENEQAGAWATFVGKGLTEIAKNPDAIKAFADVGDKHLNVEALKALAPALKSIPALGLTKEENLTLITALKNHRLTTDKPATNLLMESISNSWGELVRKGSHADQAKFVGLVAGLAAFGELEGVDLPVPVKAELDKLKVVTDQIKPHANIFAAKTVSDLLMEAATPGTPGPKGASDPVRAADNTVLGALSYAWNNMSRTSASDTASVIADLGSLDPDDQDRGYRELAKVVATDEALQATRGNRRAFVEAGGIYGGGTVGFRYEMANMVTEEGIMFDDKRRRPTLMWGKVDLFDSKNLFDALKHDSPSIKSSTGASSIWQEMGAVFSPEAVADTSDGGMWENAVAQALSPGGSHDLSRFALRAERLGDPSNSGPDLEIERAALAVEVGETIKHALMVTLINRNVNGATYFGYTHTQIPGGPASSDVAREMADTHRDQATEMATFLKSRMAEHDPTTPWQIFATTAMGRGAGETGLRMVPAR